jgi:hypothetical protein
LPANDLFVVPGVGGIAQTVASVTSNSITETPKGEYYGGAASAAGWTANVGNNLSLVGSGSNPVFDWGAPGLGDDDLSHTYVQGKNFAEPSDGSYLDLGDSADFWIDLVVYCPDEAVVHIAFAKRLTTGDTQGFVCYWASGTGIALQMKGITSTATVAYNGALKGWHFVSFACDHSVDNGFLCFANGSQAGSAADPRTATIGSISCPTRIFETGRQTVFDFDSKLSIAYLAVYIRDNWHNGTSEFLGIHRERHARWAGLWPSLATGTAQPTTVSRSSAAHMDRFYSAGTVRRMINIGPHTTRSCDRYDSVPTQIQGLLLEPQATNIQVRSSEFNDVVWGKTRCSVDSDTSDVTAPEIINSADIIREDGSAADTHYISDFNSLDDGVKYCCSLFVQKTANRNVVLLYQGNSPGASPSAYFDVDAGTVGTTSNVDAAGIVDWTQGWYRCWCTWIQDGTRSVENLIAICEADGDTVFDGLNQDSLYIWGMQLESGVDYPSSYIPTAAAAATRTADVLIYKGDDGNVAVGKGSAEMSVLVPSHNNTGALTLVSISDGGAATDMIEAEIGTDNTLDAISAKTAGNPGAAGVAGDVTDGVIHTGTGATWDANNLAAKLDGVEGAVDTSCDIPVDLDQIRPGNDQAGAQQPGGVIANFTIKDDD